MTVGELRDELASWPEDLEVIFRPTNTVGRDYFFPIGDVEGHDTKDVVVLLDNL